MTNTPHDDTTPGPPGYEHDCYEGGGNDPADVKLDKGCVTIRVCIEAEGSPHNALQAVVYTLKHLATCALVVTNWGGGR